MRSNFETYTKWIYEAFLLIAENYISLDNTFQAKATLNSIVDNTNDLSVKERATKRLEEI